MKKLIVEAKIAGTWTQIGPALTENSPLGSVSSDDPMGRQVYTFGWSSGSPGVWRSLGGVDTATPTHRTITSRGYEPVGVDLEDTPVEIPWRRPGRPDSWIRFRLAD